VEAQNVKYYIIGGPDRDEFLGTLTKRHNSVSFEVYMMDPPLTNGKTLLHVGVASVSRTQMEERARIMKEFGFEGEVHGHLDERFMVQGTYNTETGKGEVTVRVPHRPWRDS